MTPEQELAALKAAVCEMREVQKRFFRGDRRSETIAEAKRLEKIVDGMVSYDSKLKQAATLALEGMEI